MNQPKPTFDLAPMNFFQVLDHIKTMTNGIAEDMALRFNRGDMDPMTADQLLSVIHGTTCAAAEAEVRLWVAARKATASPT